MPTNHTPEYISHPLLKEGVVERRRFQIAIAREARKESLMVVLPTGLGKTTIALFVLINRLAKGKVLFLAPTRPLVEQHSAFLNDVLNIDPLVIQKLTGNVLADTRAKLWDDAKVVVSTPQIIENDLLSNRINLSTVSLIIFDECHRAVGNYSYVYIAEKYAEQAIELLVLGMTASPGSDKEKIKEICISLGVKKVESRTEYDSDVAPYIHKKDIEWRTLDVPVAIKKQKRILDAVLDERIGELQKLGYVRKKRGKDVTKKELLELRNIITVQLASEKHADLYKALSLQAEVLKITHAIDLIETQGIFAVNRYFGRLKNEALSRDGSKAAKRLLKDNRFVDAMNMAASYEGEHPKLNAVIQILRDEFRVNPNTRIIVFTNYRDTSEMIISGLQDQNSEEEGIRAVKFIGQASKAEDKGLKQKEQVEIITKFKAGDYNVLVATSVAEEGLDIPATDLVLFYEPIPSAIRSIQRKGRTARKKVGKVIVLIAKGTKDEAYYWLSRSKEREMQKLISEMRMIEIETEKAVTKTESTVIKAESQLTETDQNKTENKGDDDQSRITDFEDELKLTIFVDPRETRAGISRFLQKAGVDLKLQNLEIGDYIVSDKVCIERKTVTDFLDTLINKRRNLFEQIHRMKNEYEKPLLVIEGDSIYGQRNVHPNVVRAVMASIALDYSVPIIQTRDAADTASLIYVIAKREQMPNKTEVNPHGKKPTASLKEQQEYFVSALSNIGIMTTRKLLGRFKTIERIMAASKEELMEVENVGDKTAEHIKKVFSTEYNG